MRALLERLASSPIASSVRAPLKLLLGATRADPSVDDLDAVLGPTAGVRFARQPASRLRRSGQPIDVGALYDGSIATRGVVPSRPGSLHDVLNALVWAAFPESKRALHTRQHALMRMHVPRGAAQLPNARPREADVLAMLDEGGIVLCARDAAAEANIERALHSGDLEALGAHVGSPSAAPFVCGHAILEHVAESRPLDPRAAAYVLRLDEATSTALDRTLAERLLDASQFQQPPSWPSVPVQALFDRLARIDLPTGARIVR